MSRILTALSMRCATLASIEAILRDGNGEERQPAPRKFVFRDERAADERPPDARAGERSGDARTCHARGPQAQTVEVWQGQDPAERIANTILLCAIRDRATQVIIEPQARGVRVRFEIENGVREQKLPAFALAPIVQHLGALVGHGNTNTGAGAPQGSVRLSVDEQCYDVHFAPLLTRWGDGVTIQFLVRP